MSIRSRFPIFQEKTYLNSCSHGALSTDVREAYGRYLDEWNQLGSPWKLWMGRYEALRLKLAELIQAGSDELAVMFCASDGVNAIASALDFSSSRNRIIVSDFEFPSVGQIWHAQERRGAEVLHIPESDGRIPIEQYEQLIDERTQLVSVVYVCHRNGAKQDVRAIVKLAHRHGALVLLDAYQGLGSFSIDVRELEVDFLVGGTLKYLLSSSGCALLYVKRALIEGLLPTRSGWFAQRDIDAMDGHLNDPAPNGRRFESGTPPVPNIFAALAGVDLIQSVGPDRIEAQVRELTGAIKAEARRRGYQLATPPEDDAHGALIALRASDEDALVGALDLDGIVTSARGGNLRISPHLYNNQQDVDRLLESLRHNRQFLL